MLLRRKGRRLSGVYTGSTLFAHRNFITAVVGFTWTSFYPGNEFSKTNLYISSYDHRVTKTYFFHAYISDINAVIS